MHMHTAGLALGRCVSVLLVRYLRRILYIMDALLATKVGG